MSHDASCIFCRIVSGQAPCHRVHEDEQTLSFMDLFPVSDGHTLVVTRQHYPTLFEASEASLVAVTASARRVAHAIRAALEPDGLALAQLNGAAAGQTVFHYHMHLIPRAEGDGFSLHGRKRGDPERLAELARRIAAALPEG